MNVCVAQKDRCKISVAVNVIFHTQKMGVKDIFEEYVLSKEIFLKEYKLPKRWV